MAEINKSGVPTLETARFAFERIKDTYVRSAFTYRGLARYVSQQIEHANIHSLDKINLQFRLFGYEEELRQLDSLFGYVPS